MLTAKNKKIEMIIKKRKKKAVSPIIATVLLIAITIALFFAVFTWTKSFTQKKISEMPSFLCEKLNYDVSLFGKELIINNRANLEIVKLRIKFEKKGVIESKDYEIQNEQRKIPPGGSARIFINQSLEKNVSSLVIIPMILDKNKIRLCPEQSKTLNLKQT